MHRYLDDPIDEQTPPEIVIHRVCEEFNCLPAAAIEAIENDYNGLLFRIIDTRDYMRAKELYEQGLNEPDITKRPKGPGIDRVREIVWEMHKEKLGLAPSEPVIEAEYTVDD